MFNKNPIIIINRLSHILLSETEKNESNILTYYNDLSSPSKHLCWNY